MHCTECGASFTSKLEGMFKDIDLSKDIMTTYKQVSTAAITSITLIVALAVTSIHGRSGAECACADDGLLATVPADRTLATQTGAVCHVHCFD